METTEPNAIIAILKAIWHWIQDQNWFILSSAMVGWLNAVVAGARVMGWTQLADLCGKLEDAIQAVVTAIMTRKQSAQYKKENVNAPSDIR